jgi:hypothetical protein
LVPPLAAASRGERCSSSRQDPFEVAAGADVDEDGAEPVAPDEVAALLEVPLPDEALVAEPVELDVPLFDTVPVVDDSWVATVAAAAPITEAASSPPVAWRRARRPWVRRARECLSAVMEAFPSSVTGTLWLPCHAIR